MEKFLKRFWFIPGLILLAALLFFIMAPIGPHLSLGKTPAKESLTRFNLTVNSIKGKIGIKDKAIGFYFQRVWRPTQKADSSSIVPELCAGEFISSRRKIEFQIPSVPLEHYSMGTKYDEPEDIMFLPEKKESDTIFYYAVYNRGYMSQNVKQTAEPIACITPSGQVLALGEYFLSEKYLTQKITSFLNEISERDKKMK